MKNALVLLAALLLSGCAGTGTASKFTAEENSAAAKSSRDEFRKTVTIDARPIKWGPYYINQYYLTHVRSDLTATQLYCLRFTTKISNLVGGYFWDSAVDEDGKVFSGSVPGREVDQYNTWETISFQMERPYLDSKKETGVRLRVDGQRGRKELTLPASYITGFLQRVDAETKPK